MDGLHISEREVTQRELERMRQGFDEHQLLNGVPVSTQVRHTVVAACGSDGFVGCASGLETDNHWFYLTDLWLERPYRKQGLGSALLAQLESKLVAIGVTNVYTWTAGYEAPGFYIRQGYEQFCEFENYYLGHSRFGFRKRLYRQNEEGKVAREH